MNHSPAFFAATLIALASTSAPAQVSFKLELDSAYGNNQRGMRYGGKAETNALKKWDSSTFVAGRASYLVKLDGTSDVDDLWAQVGNSQVAFKLGKLEAVDLFPLVRDTLIENAGQSGYRTKVLRGRAKDVFHGVLNLTLGGGLGLELGLIDTGNDAANKGWRPALTYSSGPWSLAAGVEAIQYGKGAGLGFQARSGLGLTSSYQWGATKLTGSIGQGKTRAGDTAQSWAVTLDSRAGYTLGLIQDALRLPVGESTSTAVYAAYTLPLFDLKGASATVAASAAKAGGINTTPNANGLKLRLNFDF